MIEWISTEEAVGLSGYDPGHLLRLFRAGQVKAVKKGGAWWVDRKALERFLQETRKSADRRRGPHTR